MYRTQRRLINLGNIVMPNVRIFLTLFAHEFIQNRVFLAKSQIKHHINILA